MMSTRGDLSCTRLSIPAAVPAGRAAFKCEAELSHGSCRYHECPVLACSAEVTMRVAQRLAALLAVFGLIGCAPEAERTMHDLYLYGVENERLTYFYGGEGTLSYEG